MDKLGRLLGLCLFGVAIILNVRLCAVDHRIANLHNDINALRGEIGEGR